MMPGRGWLRRCSPLLAAMMLAGVGRAEAQVTTGGITGRVVDSAGVAVASVEVLTPETGLRRSATVNPSGTYTVLLLEPGSGVVSSSTRKC